MSLPGFLSVMNFGGSRILWLCPIVDFHILLTFFASFFFVWQICLTVNCFHKLISQEITVMVLASHRYVLHCLHYTYSAFTPLQHQFVESARFLQPLHK